MTESNNKSRNSSSKKSADSTEQSQVLIYPLIADSGNERVLREWIEGHDEYSIANDKPIVESRFDICLVDQPALFEHKKSIKAAKTASKPALLPVLLLASELNNDLVNADQGELADNVLTTTVDELISLPIRQIELEWRIETLLRLREQSLDLQAQAQQLRQFEQAVEASGNAIWISDTDGIIKYVNPKFESLTGYNSSEVVGNTPAMLKSDEMPENHYEHLWETVSTGETWQEDIINRRKDGSLYIADQTIAPIVDETGEPSSYIAVQTDITERKQLEEQLKRYRDIVQRIEDPIMLQDKDGQFLLVNDTLCEFAGLSAEKIEGDEEYEFMDQPTAEMIEDYKKTVLETEQAVEYSVSPTFEYSGKEAVFYTSRYPYYTKEGELAGTLAICRDVTNLNERTQQLHVLDNILRHNIRNSLTVIYGRAEQIYSETDGDIKDAAEVIIESAEELMATSEKSREITQIISEDSEIKQIEISNLLDNIIEETANDWPRANISVEKPEQITVMSIYNIELALRELLTNAIRHNDQETPAVDITVTVTDNMAEICVCDNGPGLSKFDKDVLESGEAIDKLTHGSGLGLWIVYWAVKRSYGEINVKPLGKRGTAITILLPVAATGVESSP